MNKNFSSHVYKNIYIFFFPGKLGYRKFAVFSVINVNLTGAKNIQKLNNVIIRGLHLNGIYLCHQNKAVSVKHFSPELRFVRKPLIWFGLISMWNAILVWDGLLETLLWFMKIAIFFVKPFKFRLGLFLKFLPIWR